MIYHEASIQGLFRVILIIVLIYYVFKLLGRYVFPYLLKNYINKQQQKYGQYQQQDEPQHKEGEVYIKKNPNKGKQKDIDDGEYVDYEEVE